MNDTLAALLAMDVCDPDTKTAAYNAGYDLGWDVCNSDDVGNDVRALPGWGDFVLTRKALLSSAFTHDLGLALVRGYDDGYNEAYEIGELMRKEQES